MKLKGTIEQFLASVDLNLCGSIESIDTEGITACYEISGFFF